MTQPDNLVLNLLREIRATQAEHTVTLQEVKERLGSLASMPTSPAAWIGWMGTCSRSSAA